MSKKQIDKFIERHGGNPVLLDGWFLLPSGAKLENFKGEGAQVEPSENPIVRAMQVAKYWETRLGAAENAFHKLYAYLKEYCSTAINPEYALAPPDESEMQKLEALRADILELRIQVERAQKALAKIDPRRRKRLGDATFIRQNNDALARLKNLRI